MKPISGHPIIYVDVETGGLDPERHALLSIGAVCGENTFEIRIRPVGLVEDQALAVNGIKREDLEDGVSEYEALDQFISFVRSVSGGSKPMLGGYNTQFDARFLRDLFHRHDRSFDDLFWYKQLDVFSMALGAIGRSGCSHLKDLYKIIFGVDPPVSHSALADAQTARMIALWFDSGKGKDQE